MLDALIQIGLSDKEARTYLAMLDLGRASVQNIAKRSGINRPTTYFVIEHLQKLGLVTSVGEGKKTLYAAEEPRKLKRIIEENQHQLDANKQELDLHIPQLEALFALAKDRPTVKFYAGVEGQKAMRDDASRTVDKDIYSFVNLDELKKFFPDYDNTFEHGRVKRQVKSHVIFSSKEMVNRNDDDENMRVSRCVPQDLFHFRGSVTVHPRSGKIFISVYSHTLLATVIESKEVADMFFAIWSLSWDAAEKYN